MKYQRLGDLLVNAGVINEEQLNQALSAQKTTHERLGKLLIKDGYITEAQLIETLRMQLGIDYVDLSSEHIPPEMVDELPKNIAKKYGVIPVKVNHDTLYLAMEDPLNFIAIEEVRNATKKKVIPLITSENEINRAIGELYGNEGAARAMAQMRQESGYSEETSNHNDSVSDNNAPTVRLVNNLIERAVSEGASDIHIEPGEKDMNVRMRIDGRLHTILQIPKDLQDSVISRIKVMGHLDITERRMPQDGRSSIKIKGKSIDLRLSTLPSIYGENIVIRLLSMEDSILDRNGIGVQPEDSKKMDNLLNNNSGVILIVGPTGSGKSSTMYTMVKELKSEYVNLITLEDPVEYHIDGITQVQINEKTGLTFAAGLRSILRQDPDIICVGEIRDGETAEIAMRAAMTGHLVLATLHTEDAVSAIDRLKDMGVEPYLIAGGIRGIIAQRLVRKICPNCKEKYDPDAAKCQMVGIKKTPDMVFYHGKGCPMCFQSGYRGRNGVFEFLLMNDNLRSSITQNKDKITLRNSMKSSDFVSMQDNADKLIERGITTVEEVIRTISRDD